MGTKTGVIRYNVKDRGRKHRGVDRNFDTVKLAGLINGGAVQEQVKNGDLLGFYGHWPRVQFGMNPIEGGIIGGKQVPLEPAIRTVSIKAFDNGDIEHEAEFLDTASGKLAERLFSSKVGGFSSAIDIKPAGSVQMPTGFYGFDYVLEPNFTKNRPYDMALDGVSEESMAMFDSAGEYNALIEGTNAILDQIQCDYDRAMDTINTICDENTQLGDKNTQLQSELAEVKAKLDSVQAALDSAAKAKADEDAQAALDAVDLTNVQLGSNPKFDDANSFKTARLECYEEDRPEQSKSDQVFDGYLAGRGWNR